jgi:hypothetical protein
MKPVRIVVMVLLLLVVSVMSAGAGDKPSSSPPGQQSGQPSGGPPQGGVPKEALEACTGMQQGDECTVNSPRGAMTGNCVNTPDGKFACVPAGEKPTGRPQG